MVFKSRSSIISRVLNNQLISIKSNFILCYVSINIFSILNTKKFNKGKIFLFFHSWVFGDFIFHQPNVLNSSQWWEDIQNITICGIGNRLKNINHKYFSFNHKTSIAYRIICKSSWWSHHHTQNLTIDISWIETLIAFMALSKIFITTFITNPIITCGWLIDETIFQFMSISSLSTTCVIIEINIKLMFPNLYFSFQIN